ncbi:MAG TPA: WD40 repeat domain-containing protein [Candidatus Didemnitutus sp.]
MNLAKHWAAILDDYVIGLAWSPDGSGLAAGATSGAVTIFDSPNGAVRHKLAGHEEGLNALAWGPAGSDLLATGGQDGKARFWRVSDGQKIGEAALGSSWVEHLAWRASADGSAPLLFASGGRKLAALSPDGTVAHAFPDAPKSISALAVSPAALLGGESATGISCLAAAHFGGIAVWHATSFQPVREFTYGNALPAITWSPDGRWLVAGCQDNAVHLWAPAEDIELHMSGYESKLRELSFSMDSKWLATGGGRDACVWDCSGAGPADREPMALPHEGRVCGVAFQNRHGVLASGSASGEFRLWAPTRRDPLVAEAKLPSPPVQFAWSPDDSLLAVGTEKGAVFVFRT